MLRFMLTLSIQIVISFQLSFNISGLRSLLNRNFTTRAFYDINKDNMRHRCYSKLHCEKLIYGFNRYLIQPSEALVTRKDNSIVEQVR